MNIYRDPETDEEIPVVYSEEEAKAKWDAMADDYNKWHTLGLDEKLALMVVIE